MESAHCDIAIFGGGIAGLWALHRLRAEGYGVVLIESETLGGAQTLASQGILHGGQKYNLGGKSDSITERLRDQPGRWHECIAGRGVPDLRGAKVLSDHQVMWAAGGIASAAAAAIGVKTLEGQVDKADAARPPIFDESGYRGTVYRLHETILDIKSVIEALAAPAAEHCYRASLADLRTSGDRVEGAVLQSGGGAAAELRAKAFLFAAGSGNEFAAGRLGFPMPATQRRPLKQVMLRGVPWSLYGHCVQPSPKPRATITTHPGGYWYLGGDIAEKSVGKSDADAIAFAAAELEAIFPRLAWRGFEFAAWPVDRAEPHTDSGRLPPEPVLRPQGNAALAWPTKLVLAPALAERAAAWAREIAAPTGNAAPLPLPPASVGSYPWELAKNWIRPA